MAISSNDQEHQGVSSGRRFAIGANVTIAILAATALLVAVNWICSLKSFRKDIASAGNYGISERTKSIITEQEGEIRLSLLYEPDEDDEHQQNYVDRLLDYCDELERFAPTVQVDHIATDSQREKLVHRISTTFGGEADSHKKALASFEKLRTELAADLEQRVSAVLTVRDQDSWLADFPLFARVAGLLREKQKQLQEVAEEIREFTPEGGIPKFAEATTKAKEAASALAKDYGEVARIMGQFTGLADETTRPNSPNIAMLHEVALEARSSVDSLQELVGKEGDPEPADIAGALKAYADTGVQVGATLDNLVRRVGAFAQQFPMVKQHANWVTQVKRGPFVTRYEVAGVLREAGRELRQLRLGLLGVIDTGNPQQLQQALISARRNAAALGSNAAVCERILTQLADRLASLDGGSNEILEASRGGQLFRPQIESINAVTKELEALPELKLGSVADQLQGENSIVVEANGKIRVIDFASAWPVRQNIINARASGADADRTFNGDSAIASALLAISSDKPFASVVLVSFEPPAPPQQNMFAPPPPRSIVPSRGLSVVRARLDAANFKVVDWNMASQAEKPPSEEGLQEIFVVLPPAPPAAPNPFGGGAPPGPIFSEEHRTKIKNLLDNDARMFFIASWEVVGGGFGGGFRTPPYGYAPLLEQDWGVRIKNATRMVHVEPDRQTPNGFAIGLRQFQYLPVNGFSDHVLGKPMRGTRFLIADACPMETVEQLPQGVTTDLVLSIPHKEQNIGAGVNEIIEIINKLNDPEGRGIVQLTKPPQYGPFNLMMTAERREGEKSKGKIVVMGFGGSLRDPYLQQPVLADARTVRFDPPPVENLDLFVNALYWLNETEDFIGRGPVAVPRVHAIPAGQLMAMRWFVWGVWPALVFAPGILLWYIRRR